MSIAFGGPYGSERALLNCSRFLFVRADYKLLEELRSLDYSVDSSWRRYFQFAISNRTCYLNRSRAITRRIRRTRFIFDIPRVFIKPCQRMYAAFITRRRWLYYNGLYVSRLSNYKNKPDRILTTGLYWPDVYTYDYVKRYSKDVHDDSGVGHSDIISFQSSK